MMMQMWPKCGLRSDLALEVMNDQTVETEPSLRDGVRHSFRVEGSASFLLLGQDNEAHVQRSFLLWGRAVENILEMRCCPFSMQLFLSV